MTKSHPPSRQAALVTEDEAEDCSSENSREMPGAGKRWSLPLRLTASALISFQVMAIFWPPFTFASSAGNGSSSPFADGVMSWFRPYVSIMFLDHGYFFFAPNPGPSHLVHYKVDFSDGRKPVEGVFPNLREEQPRLLYHRHFMLAEALQNAFVPPEAPGAPPLPTNLSQSERRSLEADQKKILDLQTAAWQHRRQQYELLRKSFENHLLAKHGGSQVTITRREHLLLSPDEFFRKGQRLDLPETYIDLPESNVSEVIRP
ncbi:MAG: hypothetical protein ACKVP0_26760 [Pirellulaceae bacterium]